MNTLEIHSYISFLFLFPHLPTSIHWKLCPKQIYLCTNFCSKLLNKFPLQRNLFHSQIHMVEVPLQGTYLRYYISLVLKYTEGTCGILCCLMKLHVAFGVKIWWYITETDNEKCLCGCGSAGDHIPFCVSTSWDNFGKPNSVAIIVGLWFVCAS